MKVYFLFLSENYIHVTCSFFFSIVLKRYMLYLNMPPKDIRFTRKSYLGPLSFWNRFLSFSEVSTVHFIASYFLVSEYIQEAERRAHKTLRDTSLHSYSLRELYYQCLSLNYCKSWSRWKECCNSTADWKRELKHMWG